MGEGVKLEEPQYLWSLNLSLRNTLNSTSVDLGKVGGVVDYKGDYYCGEAVGWGPEDVVGGEVDKDQLEYKGGPPHNHNVAVDNWTHHPKFAHAPLSHNEAQGERKEEC